MIRVRLFVLLSLLMAAFMAGTRLTALQGVPIALPPIADFLLMCGFDTNRISDAALGTVFPTGWGMRLGDLEDNDPQISTLHELAIAVLVDPESLVIQPAARKVLSNLSVEVRGLHTLFLLRDLERIYPARTDYFRHQEELANRMFALPAARIDDYTLEMTRLYLVDAAISNRFFPLTVQSNGKAVLNPEMQIILDYLLKPDWENKRKLIAIGRRLSLSAALHSDNSPEDNRYHEFRNTIDRYPDMLELMDTFLGAIAKIGRHGHYQAYQLTGKEPMTIAKAVWEFLRQFPFEENDDYKTPADIEKTGILDDDDFAVYAWTKFRKAGVPTKILEIDFGSVEPRAVCIFQTRDGWYSITQDRGISDIPVADWQTLPGNYYQRSVFYRTVDVEKTWTKDIDDRRILIETEEGPVGDLPKWAQSTYRRPR